MNLIQLANTSFMIAQDIAPFDTGNLAFNAMSLQVRTNGFTIHYAENIAPYVNFLEDGTRFSGKHVGFIENDTMYAISRYIHELYNDLPSSLTMNPDSLAQKSKDNPARQQRFLQSIGGGKNV